MEEGGGGENGEHRKEDLVVGVVVRKSRRRRITKGLQEMTKDFQTESEPLVLGSLSERVSPTNLIACVKVMR